MARLTTQRRRTQGAQQRASTYQGDTYPSGPGSGLRVAPPLPPAGATRANGRGSSASRTPEAATWRAPRLLLAPPCGAEAAVGGEEEEEEGRGSGRGRGRGWPRERVDAPQEDPDRRWPWRAGQRMMGTTSRAGQARPGCSPGRRPAAYIRTGVYGACGPYKLSDKASGMDRSYHGENRPSHQHWARKHHWARSVVRWGTTCEPLVTICIATFLLWHNQSTANRHNRPTS